MVTQLIFGAVAIITLTIICFALIGIGCIVEQTHYNL